MNRKNNLDSSRYCGMVLAAGFGTRLNPISLFTPKPLLPFFDSTILEFNIKLLKYYGINDIAVNSHHLLDQFEHLFNTKLVDQGIYLSKEVGEILGSGGAFYPIATFRKKRSLIILNGDVITSIDLNAVVHHHEINKAMVTIAVLPTALDRDRQIWCKDSKILGISKQSPVSNDSTVTPHGNTGVFIFENDFFSFLPSGGAGSLIDAFENAISKNCAFSAYIHPGFWLAVDSAHLYYKAHSELICLAKSSAFPFASEVLNLDSSNIFENDLHCSYIGDVALQNPSFFQNLKGINAIFKNVYVDAFFRLENCLVLPGSKVESDAKNSVIHPTVGIISF